MKAQGRQVLEIQEELTRTARDELTSMLGPMPPDLRRYKRRFDKDVANYQKITTRAHLVNHILESDILYLGDYHTLRQSQKTLMRILKELREKRDKIFVGLEMIHESQQEMVDRFVSGDIEEEQLLEQINYWEAWGFSWRNYRQIFRYGRKHNIRLVGLDLDARSDRRNLLARDRHAASIISRLTREHPDALFIVFYGDFHVARQHIPHFVEQRLKRSGGVRKSLICYQNAEPIYWRLLAQRKVHSTDVVRIDADSYCVMNTPPWIKYASYINWLLVPEASRRAYQWVAVAGKKGLRRAGAGDEDGDEGYSEVEVEFDIDDQFRSMSQKVAQLLGRPPLDLAGFRLGAIYDSNLPQLLERLELSDAEVRDLRARLVTFGGVHIPRHNLVYFADPSVNLLAEEAARLVRYCVVSKTAGALEPREDFYRAVLDAAFGFFGSKLINYKRKCNKVDDYRRFLVKHRHIRSDPGLNEHREAARMILSHVEQEQKILAGAFTRSRLRRIYSLPPFVHHRVVKGLGYILGNRTYHALMDEELSMSELSEHYLSPLVGGAGHEDSYLNLSERLKDTATGAESKTDRF